MDNQELQMVESQSTNYVPSLSMTPAMANQLIQQLDQLKKNVLRDKVDYDTIPGTPKPSLLKPGAERLLMCFGLGHRVHEVRSTEDWENGFFHYVYKVTIHKSYPTHEIVVAECIGSANSKESRYRDRWVYDNVAKEMGLNPNQLEKKQRTSKNGKPYFVYKVENPDPYSIVNTLQKMAIKRALVGATLQATGTSEFFTQDLEDMKPNTPPNQPEPTPPPTTQRKQYQQQPVQQKRQVQTNQQQSNQNLNEWKELGGKERKRFFAIAGKKNLSEKHQKAIIYFYTDKTSRAEVTETEYQQINNVIEKATMDAINHTIQAAIDKSNEKKVS